MPADVSKFLEGLKRGGEAQIQAALVAVEQFGAVAIVGDAQQLTPVKTGALQASGTWTAAELKGDEILMQVGFNTDYAAPVHEKLNAAHAVGQAKFLEAAMKQNAPKLAPFVAERVKAAGE